MKHQYYGDSRDIAKWTTLVQLARMHDLASIVQIAMLTPDDDTRHGGQRDDPADADPDVRRFFVEERERFARDPELRSIAGATRLGEWLHPPLAIEVMDAPFQPRSRAAYFTNAGSRLSSLGVPTLAFLDPDVGIAATRATEKHVACDELAQIWEALDLGSVLAVFQFEQRRPGWDKTAVELFARAVGVSPQAVTCWQYPRVAFLSSLKI